MGYSKWRTFWSGFASVFDLFGAQNERRARDLFPDSPERNEAEALAHDIHMISEDLNAAIAKIRCSECGNHPDQHKLDCSIGKCGAP